MKTWYRNIAVLDARALTADMAAQIAEIRNVAALIVAESGKALMQAIPTSNVAKVVVVPDDARVSMTNGTERLEPMTERRGLMINGKLIVSPSVSAENIRAYFACGMVNGSVLCSSTQQTALLERGISLNGNYCVYPDGARLREGNERYSAREASAEAGDVYFLERAFFEPGALSLARGGLYGDAGAVVPEAEREAFLAAWHGNGKVAYWKEGYEYSGSLDVDKRIAHKLRGKLFVDGDLTLREGVSLEKLERLAVTGHVLAPETVLDALMDKLEGDADVEAYEGTLLRNEDTLCLSSEMLEALPGRVTIRNEAELTVAENADARKLREKVAFLLNDGHMKLTGEQHGALADVLENKGSVSEYGEQAEEESEEESEEEETPADAVVIRDAAYYVI